jgi:tight adherence protein B
MWLLALGTFLAVTLAAVYVLQPAPAGEAPVAAPQPLVRGNRRLDRLLERLEIPLRATDALIGVALAAVGVAVVTAIGSGMPGLGLLAGAAVPILAAVLLRQQLSLSQAHLAAQLPDALMMMGNSLKAGHTLGHAFQTLGAELPAPLGPAFRRLDRALQMGQPPETALQELREGLDNAEIDMVVQAIRIQRETGGNLVEILTNIQGTLRERLKLKGKVHALTAQGKLSGLVVGALPFALFLFLWTTSRAYLMPFLLDPLGQQALALAFLAQISGFVMIHRIVNFPI